MPLKFSDNKSFKKWSERLSKLKAKSQKPSASGKKTGKGKR